jgi:predicted phage terminase large subunit-like protein
MDLRRTQIGKIINSAPHLVRAEACRRSLFRFIREFWEEIVDEPPVWNWHIPLICSELEELLWQVIDRQAKRYDLVINVPPGTTKTTICSIMFPVWAWVSRPPEGRCAAVEPVWALKESKLGADRDLRPKGHGLRFITGSYALDMTLKSSALSRDIIRSAKFRQYFPEIRLRADQDSKSDYSNTLKGARFSTSVGAKVMGTHAHIQVIDDPVDPEQALSDVERLRANDFMDNLKTRSVDKRLTPLVLIMQRLHEDDPTAHVLARRRNVRHLKLPSDDSWDVKPPELRARYIDGLLDPARMDCEVLEDYRRILGPYGYAGQFGQDPRPREGSMFERSWFEIVDAAPSGGLEVRGWDLAASKKKQGAAGRTQAATAAVKLKIVGGRLLQGKLVGGVVYILDDVNIFGTPGAVRRTIRNITQQDGEECIQDIPQDPGQAGKAQVRSIVSDLHGFTVRSSVESGDKVVRANPLSAQVEAGNVKLVAGAWTAAYLEEVSLFPNGRKDRVDATVRAYNRALAELSRQITMVGGPSGVGNTRSISPEQEAA